MVKNSDLFLTDSYYNVFNILTDCLKGNINGLKSRNVIFCEEKNSLMAERILAKTFGGFFNTEVYSFGNFLRGRKKCEKVLSKEGSAMAVRRVLSDCDLSTLKKTPFLAPNLADLLTMLKSANVSVDELEKVADIDNGILKNKLFDILTVYKAYENFLSKNGYEDQSSLLSALPAVIEKDEEIKNANVYLVGYTSWTKQGVEIIKALHKNALSVTAILTHGDNSCLYLNETEELYKRICNNSGIKVNEKFVSCEWGKENGEITKSLFSPVAFNGERLKTEKIYSLIAGNPTDETEKIAKTIKKQILDGKCRYRDISIAVADGEKYKNIFLKVFNEYNIPFFFDGKINPVSHPLVKLIVDFIDLYRKNFSREYVLSFVKNPVFYEDKGVIDGFCDYLTKFNVDYGRIKNPLFLGEPSEIETYEKIRVKFCFVTEKPDIKTMLERIGAKDRLNDIAKVLSDIGEAEESSVTERIYDEIISILEEQESILQGTELSLTEIKEMFISAILTLTMSVIPQYNDAVFIGDFKQVALGRCKYLFAVGLTADVPSFSEDVALLSDLDIAKLSEFNLLIEPKIKIVNRRTAENVGMGLASFTDALILSYPIADNNGKPNLKSEILKYADKLFTVKPLPETDGYLAYKQALKSFSADCNGFAKGNADKIEQLSAFYYVAKEDAEKLLKRQNEEFKLRINSEKALISGFTSPTTIEDYYSCPYYAFCYRVLQLNGIETGEMDSFSCGNIAHEIFEKFLRAVYVDKSVSIDDIDDIDDIVNEIALKVSEKKEYVKFGQEEREKETFSRIVSESVKFCKKIYLSIKNSNFNPLYLEANFGEDNNGKPKDFPPISLSGGKIKLHGKIDRIDGYKDYVRIIDYKTGKAEVKDKELFMGTKLQLFLYALAVQGKKTAGVYYLSTKDGYKKEGEKEYLCEGKTIENEEILNSSDVNYAVNSSSEYINARVTSNNRKVGLVSEEGLSAYLKYAYSMCENAANQLTEGYLMASPVEDKCDNCPYKGLCIGEKKKRSVKSVDFNTICDAVNKSTGEKDG